MFPFSFFFFFNDTATTEIYTLSLHDALPISQKWSSIPPSASGPGSHGGSSSCGSSKKIRSTRSEEHTSELQSPCNLVCRLLLEKKKKKQHLSTYLYKQQTTHFYSSRIHRHIY